MADSDKIRIISNIASFADVTKSLQEVEKALNGIVDSIKTPAEKELKETEGSTGDIQITQNADKSYTFEIRTEEGWKTPVIGNNAIKFKNKPAESAKNQDKSIDEIEVDDTSTGDSTAKKTIYDEKADKFVIARPDYDSGWVDMDRTAAAKRELTHTHGLSTTSIVTAQCFVRDAYGESDGTAATNAVFPYFRTQDNDSRGWDGFYYEILETELKVWAYSGHHIFHTYDGVNGHRDWDRVDVRILLWK